MASNAVHAGSVQSPGWSSTESPAATNPADHRHRCLSGLCVITGHVTESPAHRGTKRHARVRHNPQVPLLWGGDTEDWRTAREKNVTLVCPDRHCNVELVAVENTRYRHNPRFFRFKSKEAVCDHWPTRSRGGPETPQHDCVKARLASIVRCDVFRRIDHPRTSSG